MIQDEFSTLDLYNAAKNRREWKNLAFKTLLRSLDSTEDGRRQPSGFKRYKWDSMIAYYHADLVNFQREKENVYAGLVNFTCLKTGLSTEEVQAIFSRTENQVADGGEKKVPALVAEDTDDPFVMRISCGSVSYDISKETWETFGTDKGFLTTFLNYSFLNPESGLFWSISRDVYEALERSAGIQVLECFASPFNYNLKSFCSVFSGDRLLKYPEGVRCYGDFFKYINKLIEHPDPVRLVVNPPYTDRTIDLTSDKLVEYMTAHENGEFVAMLPDWTPQRGIEQLLEIKGSVSRRFAPNEFNLYDPVRQKTIKPVGMKMILIVNLGHDERESQEKLEELSEIITRA
jgi:hypothetical protein